ncbi:MAG: hypothetical protein V1862_12115 [Methanobacteriota archaeon]
MTIFLLFQPLVRILITKQTGTLNQFYRVCFEIPGVQGGPKLVEKLLKLPAMVQVLL